MRRISTLVAMLAVVLAFGASAQTLSPFSVKRSSNANQLRAATSGVCSFGYDDLTATKFPGIGLGSNGAPGRYAFAGIVVKGKDFPAGKIVGIDFYTAATKTTKPTIAFVIEKATMTEIVTKEGSLPNEKINTIDFDAPIELDPAKEYVVGYAIECLRGEYALLTDGEESDVIPEGLMLLLNNGSKPSSWKGMKSNTSLSTLRAHVRISGNETYNSAANLRNLDVPKRVETGKSATVNLTINNRGFDKITAVEIEFTIAGKPVTKTVTGLDIAAGTGKVVAVENVSFGDAAGDVSMIAALKKINDKTNLLASYVAEYSVSVEAPGSFADLKSVLIERFTGERCGYCPRYKPTEESFMAQIRAKGMAVNRIEHHAGFGADFLTMKESEALLPLYGPEGSYAPAVMINRTSKKKEASPVFIDPKDFTRILAATEKKGALMAIDHVTQKLEGDKFTCTVTGSVLAPFVANEYHINIVLTESDISAVSQAGAPEGWKHNDVPRLFLCSNGEKVTFVDNKFTFTKTGTIDSKWKTENMKCVVYVGEPLRTDQIANSNIYASRTEIFNTPESVSNVSAEDVDVRVVNGGILVYGNNYGVKVYNVMGEIVPSNNLVAGVYLVRVQVGVDNYVVRKVIVR